MGTRQRLRIIFGEDRAVTAEHARRLVRAIEEHDVRNPHHAMPRGVAAHSVRYPNTCDECGETFWSAERWSTHIGCRGEPAPQRNLGFRIAEGGSE